MECGVWLGKGYVLDHALYLLIINYIWTILFYFDILIGICTHGEDSVVDGSMDSRWTEFEPRRSTHLVIIHVSHDLSLTAKVWDNIYIHSSYLVPKTVFYWCFVKIWTVQWNNYEIRFNIFLFYTWMCLMVIYLDSSNSIKQYKQTCILLDCPWIDVISALKNKYNWRSFKSVYCSFIWYFSCITCTHFISLLTVIIIHYYLFYYLLSYFICNNKIKVVYTFSCPFLIDVFLIWYLWLMGRSTNMNLSSK